MDRHFATRLGIYVFLTAMLVRVAAWWEYRTSPSYGRAIVDAEEYEEAALALLRGEGIRPPYFRLPVYPWLVSRMYRVTGGSYDAMIMAHILFSAGTASVTFLLALLVGLSPVVAALAGLFFALYGPSVFYDMVLLPVSLADFLAACALLFTVLSHRSFHGWLFPAGACAALAALCVPLYLPLPAIPLLCTLDSREGSRGRRWAGLCLSLIGTLLIWGPVLIQNRRATGRIFPLTVNGGVNLFLANNPEAELTMAVRPGPDWDYLYALPRAYGICDAAGADRWFYAKALDWMASHPGAAVRAWWNRLGQLTAARELPRTWDPVTEARWSWTLRVLTLHAGRGAGLPFGLIAPLALVGTAGVLRRGRNNVRRFAPLLGYTAVFLLILPFFVVCSRYRLVLAVPLCILAAVGLGLLWKERGWRRRVLVGLAAGALMGINRPVHAVTDGLDWEAEQQILLGLQSARRGDLQAAETHYRQAVSLQSGNARAWHALGLLYRQRGELGRAVPYLEHAVELDPDFAEARLNLALCLFARDDTAGALREAEAAWRLRPRLWKAADFMGSLRLRTGDLRGALRAFYAAHAADRCVTEPLAHILYVLSTHPDSRVRNQAVADRLARRLARHVTNPALAYDVLAMWAAERGRFAEAQDLCRRAAAAAAATNPAYSHAILGRFRLYCQGRPFRDPTLPPL